MFTLKKVNKIDESIFYKQKRYGLNNKPFDIYKMRTMRTDPFIKGNTKIYVQKEKGLQNEAPKKTN